MTLRGATLRGKRPILTCLLGVGLVACQGKATRMDLDAAPSVVPPLGSTSAPTPPPWDAAPLAPAVPEGMVWIPPGALVGGTPVGVLPRLADQEMPGEQVVLRGFFISVYPYPNEEAAIPLANVTHAEAQALCEEREQRLCTELEWERACKGPENRLYEYGDRYRPEVCGTGSDPRMLPSGLRVACRSEFGVRDLHGSLWEWTSSPWGRGTKEGKAIAAIATRGGNSAAGEVTGRCANAAPRAPATRSKALGFRCCAGPPNTAEVVLHVERKAALEQRPLENDDPLARAAVRALPEEARAELKRPDEFRVSRAWAWHPIGNEELLVLGGCTADPSRKECGVVVVRRAPGAPQVLGWAGSSLYQPTLRVEHDSRYLWVYGGDDRSHFRRLLRYAHGRVTLGQTERNMKNPRSVKGPKREKH